MTSKKLIRIQNMKLIACPCLKNICAALQDRQSRGLGGQIWAEIKENHARKPCYINILIRNELLLFLLEKSSKLLLCIVGL